MLKYIYQLLENPNIYNAVQKLLGGKRLFSKIRNIVFAEIEQIAYTNVLDVGCGTGHFSDCFKGFYIGVDINPSYLEKAPSNDQCTYLVSDAAFLPFKPEQLSLVFTLGVLHHLNKSARTKMLNEMWRICKTGGHLLIIDGLVPSNRLNLLGYVLAKFDRGRFKIHAAKFSEMIDSFIPNKKNIKWTYFKIFPYELVAVLIRK
jgi:ubiquinone/menaquinone biosynthesis C-methylase UbiE